VHDGLGKQADSAVAQRVSHGLPGSGVAGGAQDQDAVQPEDLHLLGQLREDTRAEPDA
jgi:hypothetical protein